jgi:hypothetical protein
MSVNPSNIVLIGKETTRGTAAGSTPLHQPFIGAGLKIGLQRHLGKTLPSSAFPYQGRQTPLGTTPVGRLTPHVNVNTVRDLILMGLKRESTTQLNAFTIAENCMGVTSAAQKLVGAVNRSATWQFARSENPDAAALLNCEMEFAAMSLASATVSAGTQAVGNHFKIHSSDFTINGVAALEVHSMNWQLTNELFIGVHDNTAALMRIEDGVQRHIFTFIATFATKAWRDLVIAGTEFVSSLVLKTGTTNETVTLAIGRCYAETHELQGDTGTVTEQITIDTSHSDAAIPVVASFGAAIGASALSLAP